jgi:hypothetical protein
LCRRLYFSRKEYEKHLEAFKETGGWVSKPVETSVYGEMVWGAKAIYVNTTNCVYMCENEHNIKCENVVRGYSDYLYILIHELVHWYFPELEHGFKFEQKIGEIFKMIPIKEVYSDKVLPNQEVICILCPTCTCITRFYCDREKGKVYVLERIGKNEECDCNILELYFSLLKLTCR